MDKQSREVNAAAAAGGLDVRLSRRDDLPGILEISNWAIQHTASNFRTEPETLEDWAVRWRETREQFPWFVGRKDRDVVGFAMASPFQGR